MPRRHSKFLVLSLCLASAGLCVAQELAPHAEGNLSTPVGIDRSSQSSAPRGEDEARQTVSLAARTTKRADFNADVYYRNKVEFSLESGVLPTNLPFVFDFFVGGNYALSPQHYTLIPVFPSVRWQLGDVRGPSILRGNTDMTFTLAVTAIPRGPENLYDSFDLGFRRNFVQRNWRVAPYFEVRVGAGIVNAQEPFPLAGKGPLNNGFAQGQDFTFTLMMGSGFRYNFNGRTSVELGATYYHVSNAYLSEPMYDDNGINVVGPLVGVNVRLSRPREH